jgi:hypothetical protein
MKALFPLSTLLFIAGCMGEPRMTRIDAPGESTDENTQPSYTLLTDPPDAILDELASEYRGDNQQWGIEWTRSASSTPIDGQRTIRLLELACYADLMCHPVEYRLRVATHDYVRQNVNIPRVRDSLEWIRSSYKSRLPLDAPGDNSSLLKGLLVESMNIRMTEYANELLQSRDLATDR